ncbi:MAG: isoprenylcysteine carboxylmethyltransferase family protein [Nitrospirae bacterium]|nr:isoprenylcysteine carboxylmethyltransferase family protein [Nitrospirota bacterium]
MTSVDTKIRIAQIKDGFNYWVFIPAAVIVGGLAADRIFGLPSFSQHMMIIASAALLIIIGAAFIQGSTKDLAVYGDGTPNPLRPPKRLVVEGRYRLCRHPMFFGYDLAALGVVMLFRSWGMLLVSYPLFIFLECRFLGGEEQKLEKRFGRTFNEYRKRTSFLIPLIGKERKTA